MFQKILIANRGEIAVRIIRTARKMGILTVAVYAEDDSASLHVSLADEALLLPGTHLDETYMNQKLLIRLAIEVGADAIHPGYGFLSENAGFAKTAEEAGLVFIGATPAQIALMGKKTAAVDFAKSLGIPVIPGKQGREEELLNGNGLPEFPVLVKAASGGGGKGMQIVNEAGDLQAALQRAGRQAKKYFNDGTLFVEKYVPDARHIEVQVMGDGKGEVVHLYERECSTQRRYQKLIEESPATAVSAVLRQRLYEFALRIARSVAYRGAGTIEFLVDQQENCYFLEMNTRLQVEHPVTESVTGLDLVEWQIRIAAGLGLPLKQKDIELRGHAIELRICAEDPAAGFMPSSGAIPAVDIPDSVRWDSYFREKMVVSSAYDSLLGKLIVHDDSRQGAIKKMTGALENLLIGGVKTNQLFLLEVIGSETFRTNRMTTCFLEKQVIDLLNLSGGARKMIPVEMLLAACLMHHYYRPFKKEDLWFKGGHWRIHTDLQLVMDNINYRFSVLQRDRKYKLQFAGKRVELSDVHFGEKKIIFKLDDRFYEVKVFDDQGITNVQYRAHQFRIQNSWFAGQAERGRADGSRAGEIPAAISAGLFGKVVDVLIEPGDQVIKGQNLLILESMKMEFTIQSPADATIKAIRVSKGTMVKDTEILLDLES
ncbi:MAG: biotin carboxylase N-terminal domain-containing protein [Prolixibacteraceae bacterium]